MLPRRLGGGSRLGFADRFGSEAIGWGLHTSAALVQHVGVNHRRLHVFVAEKLLDRADVVGRVSESGGERYALAVRAVRGNKTMKNDNAPPERLMPADLTASTNPLHPFARQAIEFVRFHIRYGL